MFSVCSPVVKTPTRIPRGSCQRHRRTERERASKQPCERAMKGAGCFMKPRLPASRDSAPPGGLPGGRGLPALFQGPPSVGELREGHQEFWVLPFQLQQWKRTFYPAVTPGRPSRRCFPPPRALSSSPARPADGAKASRPSRKPGLLRTGQGEQAPPTRAPYGAPQRRELPRPEVLRCLPISPERQSMPEDSYHASQAGPGHLGTG